MIKKGSGASLPFARLAISAGFFATGFLGSTWLVYIPEIKARLGLSDGELGLALWSAALGLGLGARSSASVMAKLGSRRGAWVATAGLSLATVGPILCPRYYLLFPALLTFGFLNALAESCLNTQAASLQRTLDRALMSRFHAWWSIGSFGGAALGGILIALGAHPGMHAALVALTFLAVTVRFRELLLNTEPAATPDSQIAVSRGPLVALGTICLLVMLSEGAVADWSGVYLRETFHEDQALATLGYTTFLCLMFVSRLFGDWVTHRLGIGRVATTGLFLATGSLVIALLIPNFVVDIIGFGLVGLGVGNAVPLVFTGAANFGQNPVHHSIAAVATLGYMGFFIGPALIGGISEISNLRTGLALVATGLGAAGLVGLNAFRRA
jgi:MFS family permease